MSANDAARTEQKRQFLSFAIGDTHYGAPILKVKEILQFDGVTRVPGTPSAVRGVINVRGAVVPVVDLGVKFGRPEVAETKRTCVLVVETAKDGEALTLGVIADAVNEVIDLGDGEIEPPPTFGSGIRLEHVTGMGKVGAGFVVLLDMDRVLTASEAELALAAVEGAAQDEAPAAAPAA
ncbi:MAG TPA: chemotaxis protein CheW [Anaeromyxobacteraceae bacterium]|nr:chemotaxis protein CheW [Anaeromyxobacteraceae bacterium]